MKRQTNRRALTLVEMLVALGCMAILMGPIFFVYRSGSRSSLQGIAKAEITLEARRILRQIHDDLRYSVVYLNYNINLPSSLGSYYFPYFLKGGNPYSPSGDAQTQYKMLRFPLHGEVKDAIEPVGGVTAYRKPILITYELKKETPDQALFSLFRQEGTGRPILLSNRVNFFEIRDNPNSPAGTTWFTTLQLAEVIRPSNEDSNWQKLQHAGGTTINSTERRLADRTRGVQIADFFDVAASEFYTLFRRSSFMPNWQNLIKSP